MAHKQWQAVEQTLTKYWYKPDLQAVQAQLACIAAHYLTEYPPAWLLTIAPSGSAKTVLIEAVDGLPGFHQIDQLTPNSFISGQVEETPTPYGDRRHKEELIKEINSYDTTEEGQDQAARNMQQSSFLNRVGPSGIITIPDFSTILQKRQDVRDDIFAQLRRVYDGTLRREFGTKGRLSNREWRGRITALAAVTPEIDYYHSVFVALGERWMRVRWARASGLEAGMAAVLQTAGVFEHLKQVVRELIVAYIDSAPKPPEVPVGMLQRIVNISELVTISRGHVHRDTEGEIDTPPVSESNTRLPKMLAQVARGWSALMGFKECYEDAFDLVERIALDSIPPMRRHVLDCLRLGKSRYIKGISANGVDRATKELAALGLVVIDSEWADPSLTELAQDLLKSIPSKRPHLVYNPLPFKPSG